MEHGVALRIPDDPRLVAKIRRQGWAPFRGRPLELVKRGGKIAIVGDDGHVELYGTVLRYEGLRPVRLVDGKQVETGCRVYARWHKLSSHQEPLNIGFRGIGFMRYFDPDEWRPTIVGDIDYSKPGERLDREHLGTGAMRAVSLGFKGATPGLKLGSPELRLVEQYLEWIDDDLKFWTQHRLEPDGLYTDLFDRTFWRLFEAKVPKDWERLRSVLRGAVGQLLDYKRFFDRPPSIGILLPEKPELRELAFLDDLRVVAIWRTPSGQFRDSAQGLWTLDRRRG